jgi:hypothetical protein
MTQSPNLYKQSLLCWPCLPPASVGFLLGLLFDQEDRGNMFLQNIRLSQNYNAKTHSNFCIFKYDSFIDAVKNLNPTLKIPVLNLCFLNDYISYTPENMVLNIPIKINVQCVHKSLPGFEKLWRTNKLS